MMDAYHASTNNTLYKQTYHSKDQIDKHIKSRTYVDEPICFAIGWNTYSPDTKEYNIDIRMDYSQTVPTSVNQVVNQQARYND